MKKVLLSAALLGGMMFGANAQDEATPASSGYKQEAGNKTIEIRFNPSSIFNAGAADANNQFSLFDGLKFRSFTSETSAYRLGVDLTMNSATAITRQEATDVTELKTKTSDFSLMLKPGIEKHFASSERLSPYVGAELLIGFKTTTEKEEYDADATATGNDVKEKTSKNGNNGNGYFKLGLGGVAGVDYYFVKKLYIGAEVQYGLMYTANSKTINEDSGLDGDAAKVETKNGSEFQLTPNVTANIRVGWTF